MKDDLISRKAAIEVIRGILNTSIGFTCALEEMISRVETVPTVDAAPVVHGKWVMMGGMNPPEYHHHHQCSVCESFAPMYAPYGAREALTPWCPECGAKMDLGEE